MTTGSFEITKRDGRAFTVFVDAEDLPAVLRAGPWHVYKNRHVTYVQRTRKRTILGLHTFLTGFRVTDHIDGDGLNNRSSNLRSANSVLNGQNRMTNTTSTSGCRGVSWYSRYQKWQAQAKIKMRGFHLGYYEDKADACKAVRSFRTKHFEYNNPTRNQCEHFRRTL